MTSIHYATSHPLDHRRPRTSTEWKHLALMDVALAASASGTVPGAEHDRTGESVNVDASAWPGSRLVDLLPGHAPRRRRHRALHSCPHPRKALTPTISPARTATTSTKSLASEWYALTGTPS